MAADDVWIEWGPRVVGHVRGRFTQRVQDEDGTFEPQRVEATCERCGETWRGECRTGHVKAHIQRFALLHLHRDPFDSIKPT